MKPRRYFFDGPLTENAELLLNPQESHHLLRVRRAHTGDRLTLINAAGEEADGFLLSDEHGRARINVGPRRITLAPPRLRLTLVLAVTKGYKLDDYLRPLVEIGVSQLRLVITDRSELSGKKENIGEAKLTRWNRLLVEAAKQCGRPAPPPIPQPQRLRACLKDARADLKLFLWECEKSQSLSDFLRDRNPQTPATALALIGPEGGFTREESQLALDAGFAPLSLGPAVLRSETAALTTSILLLNHFAAYDIHSDFQKSLP